MHQYLEPADILDSDHPDVAEFARRAVAGIEDDIVSQAAALYKAVRDEIRYDPYTPFFLPEHYRASETIRQGKGFCIPKAALMCASARRLGIPARMGFATVRNHLATKQLLKHLGSDLFVFHGYADLYIDDRWVKATPAFNAELCRHFQVPPLDFDGVNDAIFQPFNNDDQPFMEYIAYHGTWPDVPVGDIVSAWENAYGKDRVDHWRAAFKEGPERSNKDFTAEDIA